MIDMENKFYLNGEPYFVSAAKELGINVSEYAGSYHTTTNFVIVDERGVITWRNGCPVIYGDKSDAIDEISNWSEIRNVSVITELEFLLKYMPEECKKAFGGYYDIQNEEIMDTTNGHNPELVDKINKCWTKNREKFQPILCALYQRDIKEIYNADSFAYDEWDSESKAYYSLIAEWDFYAANYLEHIADDGDLQVILDFIGADKPIAEQA